MTKSVITGGAGFIGANLSRRLLEQGHEVTIFDNLSRRGAVANLAWLRVGWPSGRLRFVRGDVRHFDALRAALEGAERIYHLAGQVAVTSSVEDPRGDFESNALGTFNVLEAVRTLPGQPVLIYASTNKVYGDLSGIELVEENRRYRFAHLEFGISESQPLDFHSPYGCSKGAGDQYVRDYFRVYGVRTVVMRQSCIYGHRQFGIEDQGWLAWLAGAAIRGKPITIFGDGKQVRDVLDVEDLLDAYEAVVERIDRVAGEVFNIGGGPQNTLSVWSELGPMLERAVNRPLAVKYRPWRVGDQRIYISDIRRAQRLLDWHPHVGFEEGLRRLLEWSRSEE